MRRIETSIIVDAPIEEVWSILTDLDRYGDWNPFVLRAEGRLAPGEKLRVTIQPPGRSAMTFSPVVQCVEPLRELRWRGKMILPGIFDGEHVFRLTQTHEGVRLDHFERFEGILVPLLWRSLEGPTREGFELMNEALRQRAENLHRRNTGVAA